MGALKATYCLSFSISCSAAFGTPIARVLSTVRSLFAVSSRCCPSWSLLSPTAWDKSQAVPEIQKWRPTSFMLMITLAMENATLTGLASTKSGTFLRSICANREATPRPPLAVTFQSESCIWGLVKAGSAVGVKVRLVLRPSSVRWSDVNLWDAKMRCVGPHLDRQWNPAHLERSIKEV